MKKNLFLILLIFVINISNIYSLEKDYCVLETFIKKILESPEKYFDIIQKQNIVDCKRFINKINESNELKNDLNKLFSKINADFNSKIQFFEYYSNDLQKDVISMIVRVHEDSYKPISLFNLFFYCNSDSISHKKIYELFDIICFKEPKDLIDKIFKNPEDIIDVIQKQSEIPCDKYINKVLETPEYRIDLYKIFRKAKYFLFTYSYYFEYFYADLQRILLSMMFDINDDKLENSNTVSFDFYIDHDKITEKAHYELKDIIIKVEFIDSNSTGCKVAQRFIKGLLKSKDKLIEYMEINKDVDCSVFLKLTNEDNSWNIEMKNLRKKFKNEDFEIDNLCSHGITNYDNSLLARNSLVTRIVSDESEIYFSFFYVLNSKRKSSKMMELNKMWIQIYDKKNSY